MKDNPPETVTNPHEINVQQNVQNVPQPNLQSINAQYFPTINFDDFTDFISIENNHNDFDLQTIVNDVHNQDLQNKAIHQTLTDKTNQIAKTSPAPQISNQNNRLVEAQRPMNPAPAPFNHVSTTTANVCNISQAQNIPFLPRMYFPNSNVTINYNFDNQNKITIIVKQKLN